MYRDEVRFRITRNGAPQLFLPSKNATFTLSNIDCDYSIAVLNDISNSMALTRAFARKSGVASPAPAATVGTTTKPEIGDGQLCVSEIAAAGDTSEAAALAPTTTEGSLAAADTSEAAALALGITRELPAAADTEPNQSSRDAAINVGATSVKTRNRAKRQDGAGAKKEGPPPKRQRQNIAGETSKGSSKTPAPKFDIPDIIESEQKGKDSVTEKYNQSVVEGMREFFRNNKTVVEGLVKDGEGAIGKVMSVSPNLGKMIFFFTMQTPNKSWLRG